MNRLKSRVGTVAALIIAGSSFGMEASARASAVNMAMVKVSNPNNAANSTGYGQVDYAYKMGKYEVTAGQYTAFLNAVAGVDTYDLYHAGMVTGAGITQSGSGTISSPYTYTVSNSFANRPVNYILWRDAARFANWMSNGQPTGGENASTTEEGSYTLDGAMSAAAVGAVTRNTNATWVVPTVNEWYKAAYYDPTTKSYFTYPTSSNTAPTAETAPGGNNSANYNGAVGSTTAVGAYVDSSSPYGTFDQGGNVWEWTQNEGTNTNGPYRVLEGGSYQEQFSNAKLYLSDTFLFDFPLNPSYDEDNNGFRLALTSAPEPGTVSLLILGIGLGLTRRRSPAVRG